MDTVESATKPFFSQGLGPYCHLNERTSNLIFSPKVFIPILILFRSICGYYWKFWEKNSGLNGLVGKEAFLVHKLRFSQEQRQLLGIQVFVLFKPCMLLLLHSPKCVHKHTYISIFKKSVKRHFVETAFSHSWNLRIWMFGDGFLDLHFLIRSLGDFHAH